MPEFVKGMGVWEGEYVYTDPDGTIRDRHRSKLTCRLPAAEPDIYLQRNEYAWDDGRTECFDFRFVLDGDRIRYDHPRALGYCWVEKPLVGDLTCIRVSWRRTDQLGYGDYDMTDCYVHELIQIDAASRERARVWQWFSNGELILRTIIKEHRTGSAESVAERGVGGSARYPS